MSNVTHPEYDDPSAFVFYSYAPSKTAAIIFPVAFACTTLFHVYQMIVKKAWYFAHFFIGGFELVGYFGRAESAEDQWSLTPYLVQTPCLLVAPGLLAASIYMVLGRIIVILLGERYSMIRKKWLT
ncbi:hypothetical protein DL95DRAFT_461852 [Leptodontidium sp. 2 PMI_412]|nr:hypothetical protein BKA61DRAFT_703318 [Leptodontidium sp. MPI-SDFR-AT-0119]KAH9214787.1 hypothetical protein DL95DRAFT_461852 [Leptodontidium sp. 2 PMI_412]